MSELITFGETMIRLSPPMGERIETARELDFRSAGAESNVAITASRLGTDACWMSKLPDSPLGRRAVKDVSANGVNPEISWSDDGRMGTYYIEQGGSPRGTSVIYDRDDAAIQSATSEEFAVGDLFGDTTAFYTSGITPALSPQLRKTTMSLLDRANEFGVTTYFDVNYRSKLWSPEDALVCLTDLFEYIDVLVVAKRDAENVLNRTGAATSIAEDLRREYQLETALVTRGADGAVAATKRKVLEQSAFDAETLDPIGTGDAFVGAFIASQLAGESIRESLKTGAATAAFKRTLAGDQTVVTPAEIERVKEQRARGINR
ncbi:2-keto-3-deoxygluconate kinase [Haloferax sp. Atlit-4N]|uniref:bifunctional 2-dehydro-3-deoxygluconokinase/2-dehydro-3- deoxygalactonokinase n=1 Tax=unclassified Haloferax TaxID=2625095 RepID=UPI000E2426C5|nr:MULTISPECIES: bifunctional 2-dehydro-3-deoxygluconokinase/2-dehydro-3-deoxygalactonokinase [unclassified Haloferax]RDZ39509.1 2-keto-3-deoxygluconate kinase [Haloferax sp. Atlit-19N]RDZ49835.1 2-keto-3-deoxygluconate kinase [Haloferax sp. Atlit-4N]